MPCGVLNEYANAGPADGCPARENSTRSGAAMSVYVPTVERAPPPTRFWLMTTGAFRWLTLSTSGCP